MVSSFLVSAGFFVAAKQGHGIARRTFAAGHHHPRDQYRVALVTYLTQPDRRATLEASTGACVRPGPGGPRIRQRTGLGPSPDSLPQQLLGWMLGCLFVYSALFGSGSMLYGKWPQAWVWIVLFVVSGVWLVRLLRRMWARTARAVRPTEQSRRIGCCCASSEARRASWARARCRLCAAPRHGEIPVPIQVVGEKPDRLLPGDHATRSLQQ